MAAETVVVPAGTPLEGLDALADRGGRQRGRDGGHRPAGGAAEGTAGKSKRLGVGVDTGLWAQEGVRRPTVSRW